MTKPFDGKETARFGNYFVIPNSVFEQGLSCHAFGILCLYQSLPPNSKPTKKYVSEKLKMNHRTVNKGFKELEEHGYDFFLNGDKKKAVCNSATYESKNAMFDCKNTTKNCSTPSINTTLLVPCITHKKKEEIKKEDFSFGGDSHYFTVEQNIEANASIDTRIDQYIQKLGKICKGEDSNYVNA